MKTKKDESLILNRLAIVMKEESITNRKLAEGIKYDETTVSLWANNRMQPALSTFARIALLLNRNLQELFVNTTNFDRAKKEEYLAQLIKMGKRGKRTGKPKKKATKAEVK